MPLPRSLIVLWVLLAAACSPVALPRIAIDRVDPAYAYTGDQTTVTLYGARFFPQLSISAQSGQPDFDTEYRAWLVGPGESETLRPFASVSLVAFDELAATLSPGHPPGTYDIRLEGPSGQVARLPNAFTVTEVKPSRLRLSRQVQAPNYLTGAFVFVDIELLDQDGQPAPFPIELNLITLDSEGTPIDVLNPEGALENVRRTPDDDGYIGVMPDGAATVSVQATEPGLVTFEVLPWNPDVDVAGDSDSMLFVAGSEFSVVFDPFPPPPTPEGYVSGVPVVGTVRAQRVAPNPDAVVEVELDTGCTAWSDRVVLRGEAPTAFEFVPRVACEDDTITVTGLEGESEPFSVVPGEATEVRIGSVTASPVQAGDRVEVDVNFLDGAGNVTQYLGDLELRSPNGELRDVVCHPPQGVGVIRSCSATPIRAGGAIELVVEATGLPPDTFSSLVVTPRDEPVTATLGLPFDTTAGQDFIVEIQPADPYGNDIDASGYSASDLVATDERNEIECSVVPPAGTAARLRCQLFTARSDARITIELVATGERETSAPLPVLPGPLATVQVSAPAETEAGADATFTFRAVDVFGNPTSVLPPIALDLTDVSGTFAAPATTLGTTGEASVTGTFERAGTTRLFCDVQGQRLGESADILVRPAEAASWQLQPAAWAWAGESSPVDVLAIDAFGNPTDFTGEVTLRATSEGTFAPTLVRVADGRGHADLSFTGPATLETIATDEATLLLGTATLPVPQRCADGPAPSLTFVGQTFARVCLDPSTETGVLQVDAGGTQAGAAPLADFVMAVDGGRQLLQSLPVGSLSVVGSGLHAVDVLAMDTEACGAVATRDAYAALDDGTPAGPVTLTTTADFVDPVDLIDVELSNVADCHGAPSSQPLRIRTAAGELQPTSPTGRGLEVTLGPAGDAVVQLETTGGLAEGLALLEAFTPDASAWGDLHIRLAGDDVAPTVIRQEPQGQLNEGSISEIAVVFSEPIATSTVDLATFNVQDALGNVPVLGVRFEDDDRRVELDLGSPLDQGTVAFTVGGTIEDLAGNALAGDHATPATDYEGRFTFVNASPRTVTCSVPTPTFRPDGDPGVGSESDTVSVDASTGTAPRWWIVDVYDKDDVWVAQRRWPGTSSPAERLTWDGRGLNGIVVDPGAYRVQVDAEDADGRRATPCDHLVVVNNGPEVTQVGSVP